jgi:hypothetical protein
MDNIRQSLLISRQIPQHIQDNYPLFVAFIKGYYDFLYEQQIFDLENVHDIEEVCSLASNNELYEKFIDKFKFELARNFPIHMVSDRGLILKHLREFYLSRGSENSFKFLFRVLFNKEASLKYPSEQMLRVSDGKWKQDISIFVKPDVEGPSFNQVNGQFVKIITSIGKVIETYVENAQMYSSDIYEVFITREYANEISAGDKIEIVNNIKDVNIISGSSVGNVVTINYNKIDYQIITGDVITIESVTPAEYNGSYKVISHSDNSFTINNEITYHLPIRITGIIRINKYPSTILPCPSKVSIWKGGSGFNVGDIFSLKTQTGNGCVIKVTKVVNDGDIKGIIKRIQVIKFGLDYQSTFFSYLSNAEPFSSEYIHPAILNPEGPYIEGDPAYNESTPGFMDSGWASKQNYFYYHDNLPINDDSFTVNRYFADPTYTGEIINQFYTDGSKPIDTSVAIIRIDLGAVAKYPGYYLNADGFISDTMYIQDGFYYQAFSYVIKVEEELQKYVDIIKTLVHPVGMKVFSEYNIYNEMNLEFSIPQTSSKLQLPEFDSPPSRVTINDIGISYSNYILTIDENGNGITVPDYNSGLVFGSKPSKIVTKNIKNTNINLSEAIEKTIEKTISGISEYVTVSHNPISIVPVNLYQDVYNGFSDSKVLGITKYINNNVSMTDNIQFSRAAIGIDSINISTDGRVRLAPYDANDSESYFAIFDDYQSSIPIP